jgi:uncharacterized membrane protein
MSENPSTWRRRFPLGVLALVAAGVATYLSLAQLGFIQRPWEPLFGDGTDRVLRSRVAAALPVPDALLGVLGYFVELVFDVFGGSQRYLKRPAIVLTFGVVATCMATGSLVLVAFQMFFVHAWCTLCLASAILSWLIFLLAVPEVLAAWRVQRRHVTHAP